MDNIPQIKFENTGSDVVVNDGIDLRDHFAGIIIVSLVANKEYKNSVGEIISKAIAEKSYEIADSMLKARKEVKP